MIPDDPERSAKSEVDDQQRENHYDDVVRTFQLVFADLLGPIFPPALGGYTYVSKFVDQHTKWKEVFLIKEKPQALDTLESFNKALVIPTGLRLERLRTEKGTEFTSSAFRKYCVDIGVKQEFASTNTPQQIRANQWPDERLQVSCVAC